MNKVFSSLVCLSFYVLILEKGWASISDPSEDYRIQSVIQMVNSTSFLRPYQKEALIEAWRAAKTEKQKNYVEAHIRKILTKTESFKARDELLRLFEDLDKEDSRSNTTIDSDILDSLINLCEIPVSGAGPQGHFLNLIVRYVSSVGDLDWKISQIKTLARGHIDTLWDLKRSLYILIRLPRPKAIKLIGFVHLLLEKTNLKDEQLSRLRVLGALYEISKFFVENDKFTQHIVGIADTFRRYQEEKRVSSGEEELMLLAAIEDGPKSLDKNLSKK